MAQERARFPQGSDTLLLGDRTIYFPDLKVIIGLDTLKAAEYTPLPNARGLVLKEGARDSVLVLYKSLSVDFFRPVELRPLSDFGVAELKTEGPFLEETESTDPLEGLNRSGSLSRTLSVGNAQNAVLNSSLNLQLSGSLGNATRLEAVIAENSLPNPGSGVAQSLREYDQLYIELRNPEFGRIRAGDLDLSRSDARFLNFEKRVTGGLIDFEKKSGNSKYGVLLSGALARGRFRRMSFFGLEGNQGPYVLTGAGGERSIRLISGSERVYIDGVLLERGGDRDYIIDPLTSELRFTNLRPIRRENRIVVEFQYTDQNYLRSAFYTRSFLENAGKRIEISAYSEQDDPNRPLSSDLSDADRARLAQAGDRAGALGISTIQAASGVDGEIRYQLTDSLGYDSVLVFIDGVESEAYTATFTEVGAGKGNYLPDRRLASGVVYRWVEPVAGVPAGTHEPVRPASLPTMLQVLDVRFSAVDTQQDRLEIEAALSRNVANRFSQLDRENDLGWAAGLKWNRSLSQNWSVRTDVQYNDAYFRTVERIRNLEFARDWNISSENRELALLGMNAQLRPKAEKSLGFGFEVLNSGSDYLGFRPSAAFDWDFGRDRVRGTASFLMNRDSASLAQFARYQTDWKHRLSPDWNVGLLAQGESNRRQTGKLISERSYAFHEAEAFTETGDSTLRFVRMGMFARSEDSVRTGELQRQSLSYGARTVGLYHPNQDFRTQWSLQYRSLEPAGKSANSTLTARWSAAGTFWKRAFDWSVLYEALTAGEPIRNPVFIRVPDGTGTHTWIDYNDNGLEELEEFEPARFADQANYARGLVPAEGFLRAAQTLWSHTLNWSPGKWAAAGTRPLWSRFDMRWYASASERSVAGDELNALNPFRNSKDSLLLGRNRLDRLSLFYNRSRLDFGADYHFQTGQERTLTNFGLEQTSTRMHEANLRLAPNDRLSYLVQAGWDRISRANTNAASRNYAFQGPKVELNPAYQFSDRWKSSVRLGLRSADSENEQPESLDSWRIGLEFIHTRSERASLNASVSRVSNNFSGSALSPLGYAMLEGLQPGSNLLWSLVYSQRLLSFLQLDLRYEGRYASDSPAVHNGSVQLKAVF